jgi:hypothetical protein
MVRVIGACRRVLLENEMITLAGALATEGMPCESWSWTTRVRMFECGETRALASARRIPSWTGGMLTVLTSAEEETKFGADAVMKVEPDADRVETGTLTEDEPWEIVTTSGTVAMYVLDEVRKIWTGAVATAGRLLLSSRVTVITL